VNQNFEKSERVPICILEMMMAELVVHNCDVLRLVDGKYCISQNQDIFIHENRIRAILPAENENSAVDDEVICGSGLLAVPGFINTHAHIPMVLFRGLAEDISVEAWFNDYIWPLESNLLPEDVYWGALLGMAEMIENGITSVADHYFFMDQVAEAACLSGMRVNLAWTIFEHEGVEKLEHTSRFVQEWNGAGKGLVTAWLGPHAPYTCGPDYLRLCAQRAQELGTGIHIHVSETAAQVDLSIKKYGKTPVKMLAEAGVLKVPCILGHCVYPSDADLVLLKGSGAGIAHAPKTYLKLGMGTAPVMKFRANGIPVGLATDGAVSSNSLDILEQMRLMALTQKQAAGDSTQFTIHEVLDTTFRGGAAVMKMENELGDISDGKLADITLLRQDGLNVFPRFNPLANLLYSSRTSDVDTVICNGKVLLRGRKLMTMDKEQIKREISTRLERLNQRVAGVRIATYPT
jgi:5-methylthioadenosine/S-adenosylhomocysteine deaminase